MSYRFINAITEAEKQKTIQLLRESNLSVDPFITETFHLYDGDDLIGTISYHDNVIKMIAIKRERQGEQLLGHLLQHVMRIFDSKGIDKYFIYTKPEHKHMFLDYPLSIIIETKHVVLLENRLFPIKDQLLSLKLTLKPKHGVRAGIVMNCNPFTKGHLYLIETCAKMVDEVLIFLVEENRSVFSYPTRLLLLKKGIHHLKNVQILPSTPYLISHVTFPSYFIKDKSEVSEIAMETDIMIFKHYFIPLFELSYRFVGSEPLDPMTSKYNEMMKGMLGDHLKEIERETCFDQVISASKVRELMREKRYKEIKPFVPKSTYKYLMSNEGKSLFHA
ncbi:MAG: adenylyltransferase/cytidyltransferase family protein [Acholeplasmataceae bacterium]|jgi:[citrate (pro-3S)-lyase] ligase|nr:adenylyltransferase/cytidyltransferase family protein [Acholeplasmataceae bacterium]